MPKEGLNLYFTITDKATSVLTSIGDKTKALDKETQQLAQSYQALQTANKPLLQRQKELKASLEEQSLAVSNARKEYKKYGDEMSGLKLQLAVEEQDALKLALKEVEAQMKSNHKTFDEYRESVRKGALGGEGSGDATLRDMAKGLATGQVGQMVAASLGEALSFGLSSAIGVPEASMISNTLSSTISGIAAGAVAGIPGMIIGGLVGAGSGALSGYTEIQEAKDDAFKEYYAGLYEDVNAATESMISSGSVTAGGREQTFKAFAKRLGGDAAARSYLGRVESMAAKTNYGYDEITGYSKLLLNSYDPDAVFGVLQSLSDATAGLDLQSSDVSVLISGLSRMRTTGKATTEYLNYFTERGIDAYSALSEALGVDKSGIAEMISGGEIGGEFAAQALLDYIDRQYGGLSEDLMTTYDAMAANLEDIMTSLDAAAGEGYNALRKEGLAADAEAYSGVLGEAMKEINRISGENQAYMENLSAQYTREALSAVLLGEGTSLFSSEDKAKLDEMSSAYAEASAEYESGNQDAGLKMERLREEAEALATAAYESSEQYQTLMDTQMDQIEAIRENTASLDAATNEYRLAQELSKGAGAVIVLAGDGVAGDGVAMAGSLSDGGWYDDGGNYHETESDISGGGWYDDGGNWHPHAYGLDRVPYDGYPALLHEGERVKTAAQARAEDAAANQPFQIIITGNSFSGTAEDMADQLAELLVRRLEEAATLAVPK